MEKNVFPFDSVASSSVCLCGWVWVWVWVHARLCVLPEVIHRVRGEMVGCKWLFSIAQYRAPIDSRRPQRGTGDLIFQIPHQGILGLGVV